MKLSGRSKLMLGLATAGLAAISIVGAQADGHDTIVALPAEKLQWEVTLEGVAFAPLQGDRSKTAYMAMVRLPAGLVSPAHVKTANMYGLVVSGKIANISANGDEEVGLGVGSYYKIPANLPHISKCVSEVDCVTFLYQDGKFDFLPVEQ